MIIVQLPYQVREYGVSAEGRAPADAGASLVGESLAAGHTWIRSQSGAGNFFGQRQPAVGRLFSEDLSVKG